MGTAEGCDQAIREGIAQASPGNGGIAVVAGDPSGRGVKAVISDHANAGGAVFAGLVENAVAGPDHSTWPHSPREANSGRDPVVVRVGHMPFMVAGIDQPAMQVAQAWLAFIGKTR